MSTESYMKMAVSLMVNSLLFGVLAVLVLTIPALNAKAATLMPLVVTLSLALALPIAASIAPRLRIRTQRVNALRARLKR